MTLPPASARPWWGPLFEPVDAAGLAWMRIVFGLIMVWEVLRYWSAGWIDEHYVAPTFHFTYYPFDFVRPLPGDWMYLHFAVMGVLGLCIALGLFFRLSAVLFFFSFTWFFLIEQAKYLNHLYLVCLVAFLFMFLPAASTASLDALRRPDKASQTVPAWSIWILRFQIGVVYFGGGIAKLNADWLRGEPLRAWLGARADYPLFGPLLATEAATWFFSYAGLLFDLFIPFLLLWRPTRILALLMVLFFHLTNEYLFSIGIFPYLMTAASLVFCAPSWPRRVLPFLFRGPAPVVGPTPGSARPGLVLIGLAAWVAIQVGMPLRHWAYPGNVSWTEEGHLYAWHMKLRSKSGRLRYHLLDKQTGETWIVRPEDILSSRQARKLKTRPDLIHQLAIELATRARADGHPEVAVHAESIAALNGRDPQLLIDPKVDLAAQPRDLWPKPWIVPLREPLPPRGKGPRRGAGDDE